MNLFEMRLNQLAGKTAREGHASVFAEKTPDNAIVKAKGETIECTILASILLNQLFQKHLERVQADYKKSAEPMILVTNDLFEFLTINIYGLLAEKIGGRQMQLALLAELAEFSKGLEQKIMEGTYYES